MLIEITRLGATITAANSLPINIGRLFRYSEKEPGNIGPVAGSGPISRFYDRTAFDS